jgi:hypothetical protein
MAELQADFEFEVEISEDGKEATLRIRGEREMTFGDLMYAIESYLEEIGKAAVEKEGSLATEH